MVITIFDIRKGNYGMDRRVCIYKKVLDERWYTYVCMYMYNIVCMYTAKRVTRQNCTQQNTAWLTCTYYMHTYSTVDMANCAWHSRSIETPYGL